MPTRVERFLTRLIAPFQTFHDVAQQVRTLRSIEDAEGVTLTALGNLVGQGAADVDEDTFRAFVRARIRANRSSGVGNHVLRVARLVLAAYAAEDAVVAAGTLMIAAVTRGRASFVLRIENVDLPWSLATTLAQSFLEAVSGTGIRAVLEFMPQEGDVYDDIDRAFMCDDGVDDGYGWGDALDATSGGMMAAVVE